LGSQKHAKFGLIWTTSNFDRTDEDIQNRTSTCTSSIMIHPMFGEKSLVNFGPLITEI